MVAPASHFCCAGKNVIYTACEFAVRATKLGREKRSAERTTGLEAPGDPGYGALRQRTKGETMMKVELLCVAEPVDPDWPENPAAEPVDPDWPKSAPVI